MRRIPTSPVARTGTERTMRSLTPRLSVLLALALTACNSLPGNGGDQLTQGTTDFTSAGSEDSSSGSSQKSGDNAMAEGAPSANDAVADRNSGTQRTVEEGDVFRMDAATNTLYVLNMYRGLQIVDVADRDTPRKRGTAPILGAPVEMYLRDGYAIVVVSDYFSWQQVEDGQLRPFHGSQVRVVDVRNPDAPVEVSRVEVEGAVSETRMVGDVLYVVANRWAWYGNSGSQDVKDALEVTSVDLADPSAPRQGNTLRYEGTSNVVHASPTTLYVSSPRFDGEAHTTVHVVDIADAGGTLAESGAIEVPGTSEHRFQLDEYENTFRIVTHEGGWGEQGAQHLTVFQRGDDKAFAKLGELALTSTGGLFSTRFDGDRAYLVTMVSVDPLHVVDLKDPSAPTQVELEIPGVIQQLVPRGDRLLALGTDNGWAGVAASLFDVADPTKPALLARTAVGKGSAWSNANWDDKALRVLDDQGMMLVPFQGWVQEPVKQVDPQPTTTDTKEEEGSSGSSSGSSGTTEPSAPDAKPSDGSTTGRYVNGFQIIGFDRETLSALGVVEQEGPVGRTTFHDERILSISDRVLQSVDATDRKAPRVTAKLELARDVNDFVLAAGHAVTLSTSGWTWESTVAELRVAAASSPEDGVVGRLELPFYPQRLLPDGDGVVVLGYPHSWDGTARAVRVSLADAANPVLVGAPVKLGAAYAQDGSSTWLNLQSAVVARDGVVAVPAVASGPVGDKWVSTYAVVTVELASGTVGGVELPGTMAGELMVSDGKVWTSHQESSGTVDGRAVAKYFADAVNVSSAAQPALEARINIPGALLAVEGDLLFTRDYQWLEEGKQINALAVVRREGDKARLLDYEKLDAELGAITVHDGRLYAVTAPWWWAGSPATSSVSSSDGVTSSAEATEGTANQPPPSLLKVYALSDNAELVEVSSTPVMAGVQVRAEAGGHLLLGAGGGYYGGRGGAKVAVDMAYPGMYFGGAQALLDYALTDPDRPAYRQAIRTPGWVQGLAAQDDVLFISSGIYGIQRIKLTP